MERLTENSNQTSHENGICCTHFRGPECLGVGGNCAMNCKWEEAAWSRLAACEDTGLTPEEVLPKEKAAEIALKLMRLADLESLCSYTRLRELAEADRDGRVVVLPCKVGDTVYRIFNPPGRKPVISAHTLMSVDYIVRWLDKFGKTVFLTREEAENALEATKDD